MDWFAAGRDVVLLAIGALVFYWGLARQQQDKLWQKDLEQRDLRIQSLERTLDRAGGKTSDLSSIVQGLIGRVDQLPENLRPMFMDRALAEERQAKLERDLDELWSVVRLKERRAPGGRT